MFAHDPLLVVLVAQGGCDPLFSMLVSSFPIGYDGVPVQSRLLVGYVSILTIPLWFCWCPDDPMLVMSAS